MGYKSDAQRKAVHASKAEKSGLKAKSPYMMYDKKSGVMMSESPLMKNVVLKDTVKRSNG